jgi:fructokinase
VVKIVSLGELLIDFTPGKPTPTGEPTFTQNPGGAPANLLVAAAKFGAEGAFIGKVGPDAFGDFLAAALKERRIGTSGLVRSPSVGTTLAFVHLSESGERSFSFYRNLGADMTLTPDEVNLALVKSARIFHFGSLSLTHPEPYAATLLALQTAKEAGAIISFDPNYRAQLWPSPAKFQETLKPFWPLIDILKVSEEESRLLTDQGPTEALKTLAAWGPKVVLISLGPLGAGYLTPYGLGAVKAPKVKVVDTTAAGDAFFGAFLGRLATLGGELSALDDPQISSEILAVAVAAGSLTCQKKGAFPAIPDSAAVLELAQRL